MPTKGFFDTFNPEMVVPLAMKKFDIDLAQKKLDMDRETHDLQVSQIKEKIALTNRIRARMKEMLEPQVKLGAIPELPNLELTREAPATEKTPSLLPEGPVIPPVDKELELFDKVISNPGVEYVRPNVDVKELLGVLAEADPAKALEQMVELRKSEIAATKGADHWVRYVDSTTGEVRDVNIGRGERPPVGDQWTTDRVAAQNLKPAASPSGALSDVAKRVIDVHGKEAYDRMGPDEVIAAYQKIKAAGGGGGKETVSDIEIAGAKDELAAEGIPNPSKAQLNNRIQKNRAKFAGEKTKEVETAKGSGQYTTWSPAEKESQIVTSLITGKDPRFGWGDRISQGAFRQDTNAFMLRKGLTPQDVAVMQSDYRAGDMTLKGMKKQEGPMRAFVSNINKQMEYVDELYKYLGRTDVRAIDMPLRELKTRLAGSGHERALELFMQEISAESVKLSQGSSASIAQIPEGARKDWVRIHDVNLSLKEIRPVLDATKKMANMRLDTWVDAKDAVRGEIKAIGAGVTGGAGGGGGAADEGVVVDPSKVKILR